jgi:uncharacterized protein YaaR (DUF327 family)
MISKRTLEKWRKESLKVQSEELNNEQIQIESRADMYTVLKEFNSRIIKLTQELLDQQLLNKK